LFDSNKSKPSSTNKENNASLANGQGGLQSHARIVPSNEVKFSKMSGDNDMNLMINKSMEEINRKLQQENLDLKDGYKLL